MQKGRFVTYSDKHSFSLNCLDVTEVSETKEIKYFTAYVLKLRIYKTKVLPLVLYGCETWSLISREEHKLRVKNGVFWVVTPCGSCKN
jgi:hypothetical protein